MDDEGPQEIVIFDFDGVIAIDDGSWGALHRAFNTVDIQKRMYEKYQRNELTFREWTEETVELWSGRSASALDQAVDYCSLTPGITGVLSQLEEQKRVIGVISGGVEQLIKSAPLSNQFDFIVANSIRVQENKISGDIDIPVTPQNKLRHIEFLLQGYDIDPNNCTLIGDSLADLRKPDSMTTAIALNSDSKEAWKIADYALNIEQIEKIPQLI